MTYTPPPTLQEALDRLPRGLMAHVERVVAEARRLARVYGLDEERVTLAAWGHDIARGMTEPELLAGAAAAGLATSAVERSQPILLHGPLGAVLLASRHGVTDAEVLAAARHHTTAREGMSLLEKVIFVADKIEPG